MYPFILVIVFISCINSNKDIDATGFSSTEKTKKYLDEANINNFKNTLSDIPVNWVMLSNTNDGLIIYQRNGKIAYTLNISDDTITKGGYMEDVKWKIINIEKINNQNYVLHLGEKVANKTYGRDTIEIINTDLFLSIHNWYVLKLNEDGKEVTLGNGKNLIIPFDKKDLFKNVEESNLKIPDSRIDFIDIDFVKVREMYSNNTPSEQKQNH